MSDSTQPELVVAAKHLAMGDTASAHALVRSALGSCADDPERLLATATQAAEIGMRAPAEEAFEGAMNRWPHSSDLRFRWAVFLHITGRPKEALAHADQLLETNDNGELHALRAMSLRRLRRIDEAASAFQEALRRDPRRVEWWNQVGDMRLDQRRLDEAIRSYNAGLKAMNGQDVPPRTVAYTLLRLADCFARANLIDEAWRFSESALQADPGNVRARWTDLHLLPIVYTSTAQLDVVRHRYMARLAEMSEQLDLEDPVRASLATLSMKIPFYLHYQGGNMEPTMARFGALASRCIRAWRPDMRKLDPPAPAPNGKIRVGFCSYLFRQHTITKLFGGWIRDLDRSRFEVHTVHLGPKQDDTTRALAACSDSFTHLPDADAPAACQAMRDKDLDVVIYPELGMAKLVYQVAALRAAPVQAVAWGHPITTGLDAMDLFLSSEVMEPDDGATHYTESLIRLPGISIRPSRPRAPSGRDRASFGLAEDDIVFLIPQSLFKLLPAEDALYVRILQQVPKGRLVFLHHHNEVVTGLFCDRISRALREAHLDPARRLHFVPQLDWGDYLALNACADVFLDGLTWSGGMTTLEALSVGLVPVTLPGETMRARHTAGILTELGVTDTIAKDRDEWVRLAVMVASDPDWRRELAARIAPALERLYEDPRPIRALEQVLSAATAHQRKPTVAVGTTL